MKTKEKKAYTAPKIVSEPLKIGVFGKYGSPAINKNKIQPQCVD
jgi:hypothetical protein